MSLEFFFFFLDYSLTFCGSIIIYAFVEKKKHNTGEFANKVDRNICNRIVDVFLLLF